MECLGLRDYHATIVELKHFLEFVNDNTKDSTVCQELYFCQIILGINFAYYCWVIRVWKDIYVSFRYAANLNFARIWNIYHDNACACEKRKIKYIVNSFD